MSEDGKSSLSGLWDAVMVTDEYKAIESQAVNLYMPIAERVATRSDASSMQVALRQYKEASATIQDLFTKYLRSKPIKKEAFLDAVAFADINAWGKAIKQVAIDLSAQGIAPDAEPFLRFTSLIEEDQRVGPEHSVDAAASILEKIKRGGKESDSPSRG